MVRLFGARPHFVGTGRFSRKWPWLLPALTAFRFARPLSPAIPGRKYLQPDPKTESNKCFTLESSSSFCLRRTLFPCRMLFSRLSCFYFVTQISVSNDALVYFKAQNSSPDRPTTVAECAIGTARSKNSSWEMCCRFRVSDLRTCLKSEPKYLPPLSAPEDASV